MDLSRLRTDSSFVRALPGDPSGSIVPRNTPGVCYSEVHPTPVHAPMMLAWSTEVAQMLGLSADDMRSPALLELLAGNRVPSELRPYAARYGGHQFGHWAGQLGDGRAITLTELLGAQGERYEVQLKGAGPTPYSRRADGRAVLRSSLREFVCSEAMHHLGVPTTRALALVSTGDRVLRDMFYDGNARYEPGAIVTRVAPTFVRFGNFQIHAAAGEHAQLGALADYVITHHFPELGAPSAQTYGAWLDEVARRTALMVAHWMRVGFVHGVMNTDNMSILGLTIDYGPYGFLDAYEPDWTPNTTDAQGRRYRFEQQPHIALWNLAQLGRALGPLFESPERVEAALEVFRSTFEREHLRQTAQKFGLRTLDTDDDIALLTAGFEWLASVETDMTIFFRNLARVDLDHAASLEDAALVAPLLPALYESSPQTSDTTAPLASWLRRFAARVATEGLLPEERRELMNAANPKYIPRNYLAQEAIDEATEGHTARLERLLEVMRRPYDEQPEHEALFARRPEWARHKAGCSALSCSS